MTTNIIPWYKPEFTAALLSAHVDGPCDVFRDEGGMYEGLLLCFFLD